MNTNFFFLKLFGRPWDTPPKIPVVPPKSLGHAELFAPPPLAFTWKTPTPPEDIGTKTFGFGFLALAWELAHHEGKMNTFSTKSSKLTLFQVCHMQLFWLHLEASCLQLSFFAYRCVFGSFFCLQFELFLHTVRAVLLTVGKCD